MLSKYFEIKTADKDFKEHITNLLNSLKDKKVLLYGAGQGFQELNKIYKITEMLNITAIADKKFEKDNTDITGLKQISPNDIKNNEFDTILITNEKANGIKNFLINDLGIGENQIQQIFKEEIKDEAVNLNYLYKHHFDKTLPKLIKKLKGKSVLVYGAGAYFELVKKYFDLSGLNIIGISDKRFEKDKEITSFEGYKTYTPEKIKDLKPDYVIVATKFYTSLIENLYYNTLKGSKIRIKPLVRKSFWTLLKEIWN